MIGPSSHNTSKMCACSADSLYGASARPAKSFSLIDDGVFAREDLAAVEAMQRGIASGANHSLLFGRLEYPALWFHEAIDRCLSG